MAVNKLFLYISTTLGILVILLWSVFYSNYLANNSIIINLRNSFFLFLDPITPKGLFIYKARPISYEYNQYVYKFPGKFQKIDFDDSTITLKDLYGKDWTFEYTTNKREDGNQSNFESIDYLYVLKKKNGSFTKNLSKMVINKNEPSNSFSHFSTDDVIILYWSDNRKMSELNSFHKSGGIIKLKGAKLIQINKVAWE